MRYTAFRYTNVCHNYIAGLCTPAVCAVLSVIVTNLPRPIWPRRYIMFRKCFAKGITLFTLIHDPILEWKTGHYCLIYIKCVVMLNVNAQISAHTACFLEHLQLYL